MIAMREPETVPEETPVGEHNTNLAEGMVRRVREQARSIISQMESGVQGKMRNQLLWKPREVNSAKYSNQSDMS